MTDTPTTSPDQGEQPPYEVDQAAYRALDEATVRAHPAPKRFPWEGRDA